MMQFEEEEIIEIAEKDGTMARLIYKDDVDYNGAHYVVGEFEDDPDEPVVYREDEDGYVRVENFFTMLGVLKAMKDSFITELRESGCDEEELSELEDAEADMIVETIQKLQELGLDDDEIEDMMNALSEEMETEIVTVTDPEGNETDYELLADYDYEGHSYLVLGSCDGDEGEIEVYLADEEGDPQTRITDEDFKLEILTALHEEAMQEIDDAFQSDDAE